MKITWSADWIIFDAIWSKILLLLSDDSKRELIFSETKNRCLRPSNIIPLQRSSEFSSCDSCSRWQEYPISFTQISVFFRKSPSWIFSLRLNVFLNSFFIQEMFPKSSTKHAMSKRKFEFYDVWIEPWQNVTWILLFPRTPQMQKMLNICQK